MVCTKDRAFCIRAPEGNFKKFRALGFSMLGLSGQAIMLRRSVETAAFCPQLGEQKRLAELVLGEAAEILNLNEAARSTPQRNYFTIHRGIRWAQSSQSGRRLCLTMV
jgi:hypothetical protein